MASPSSRPVRATPDGQAYLDLQNRARREGVPTEDLFVLYVLERFLWRLSRSRYADSFVLKGGLLLAAFNARRTTADADLLARNVRNDAGEAVARIAEICSLEDGAIGGADGVRYDTSTVRSAVIRETAHYAGYRVRMQAHVARARPILSVDVNFGDPVVPGPRRIPYQALRPGMEPFEVLSYPVETILAEKLCTAVELGDANTRIRDYLDIWRLIRNDGLDVAAIRPALEATAAFRGRALEPLSGAITTLASRRQRDYEALRRKRGLETAELPETLEEIVADVSSFADPVLGGELQVAQWMPKERRWSSAIAEWETRSLQGRRRPGSTRAGQPQSRLTSREHGRRQ